MEIGQVEGIQEAGNRLLSPLERHRRSFHWSPRDTVINSVCQINGRVKEGREWKRPECSLGPKSQRHRFSEESPHYFPEWLYQFAVLLAMSQWHSSITGLQRCSFASRTESICVQQRISLCSCPGQPGALLQ
ncbi:uncharacterized protein LOC144365147 [Ictidomys tridecemlineatus]